MRETGALLRREFAMAFFPCFIPRKKPYFHAPPLRYSLYFSSFFAKKKTNQSGKRAKKEKKPVELAGFFGRRMVGNQVLISLLSFFFFFCVVRPIPVLGTFVCPKRRKKCTKHKKKPSLPLPSFFLG